MELDLRKDRDTLPPGLRYPATCLCDRTLWALETYVEIHQMKIDEISAIYLDVTVGDISSVCEMAEEIAKKFQARVCFQFNNRPIKVFPSAAQAAASGYYADQK